MPYTFDGDPNTVPKYVPLPEPLNAQGYRDTGEIDPYEGPEAFQPDQVEGGYALANLTWPPVK